MSAVAIFVEGMNDKRFIDSLSGHMNLPNIEVCTLGGGVSVLENMKPQIELKRKGREGRKEGKSIAVILDADSDADGKRVEFEKEKNRLELPINRLFLVPDDRNSGCLETLLKDIATPQHREIYNCFSKYEECLREHSGEYRLPDFKARIYAYCEAVGNGPKEEDRDYGDKDHWDLDAPVLTALKEFLRECAKMPPPEDTA